MGCIRGIIKLGTGDVFVPVDKTSCCAGSERTKNDSNALGNGRFKVPISDRSAEVQKVMKIDSFEALLAIFWRISRTSGRVRPSVRPCVCVSVDELSTAGTTFRIFFDPRLQLAYIPQDELHACPQFYPWPPARRLVILTDKYEHRKIRWGLTIADCPSSHNL